jgi:hypothetical protein
MLDSKLSFYSGHSLSTFPQFRDPYVLASEHSSLKILAHTSQEEQVENAKAAVMEFMKQLMQTWIR